jgi:hypothetical protein
LSGSAFTRLPPSESSPRFESSPLSIDVFRFGRLLCSVLTCLSAFERPFCSEKSARKRTQRTMLQNDRLDRMSRINATPKLVLMRVNDFKVQVIGWQRKERMVLTSAPAGDRRLTTALNGHS